MHSCVLGRFCVTCMAFRTDIADFSGFLVIFLQTRTPAQHVAHFGCRRQILAQNATMACSKLQGPGTLEAIADWPRDFRRGFRHADSCYGLGYEAQLLSTFRQDSARRLVLTSCFSGVGGAETALAMLSTLARDEEGASADGSKGSKGVDEGRREATGKDTSPYGSDSELV